MAFLSFIRKHTVVIIVFTVISAIAGIGILKYFNTSETQTNTVIVSDIEKYRNETKNFTFCEMGDLVGDDVKRINYKEFFTDYHTTDFSQKDIETFVQECLNYDIKEQYQLDCCMRYKMYP